MKFDEQMLAILSHSGGWLGQFTLSAAESMQLLSCVKPPVANEAMLAQGLQRIFEATCHREFARQTDQKLTTIGRTAKKKILDGVGAIEAALEVAPFALAIDAEYDELRRGQADAPSLLQQQKDLRPRLDLFRYLAKRVEFEVTRGGNEASFGQMISSLAQLFEDATGRQPTRSYVQSLREGQTAGDDGELLDLAQRMAGFVNGAVHAEIEKRGLPAKPAGKRQSRLTKIVRNEIRARSGQTVEA